MPKTLELPDGTMISLEDWSHGDLQSAFVLDANSPNTYVANLFAYTRGTTIPHTNITAGREHTNVPRSGDNGLPRDWEMIVTSWRANINVPHEAAILEWAGATNVTFIYNAKSYANTPLLDLLQASRTTIIDEACQENDFASELNVVSAAEQQRRVHALNQVVIPMQRLPRGVRMRENLGFQVMMETSPHGMRALKAWLQHDARASTDTFKTALVQLEMLTQLVNDVTVRENLVRVRQALAAVQVDGIARAATEIDVLKDMTEPRVQARLQQVIDAIQPQRKLMGWIHLEGPINRIVV